MGLILEIPIHYAATGGPKAEDIFVDGQPSLRDALGIADGRIISHASLRDRHYSQPHFDISGRRFS